MSEHVRLLLLGPVEVWQGDQRLPLRGRLHERVLAALLLEAGHAVPLDTIVDHVWDENPPESASHQVRKAVSGLRRSIPGGARLIETVGAGYRIALVGEQYDVALFTQAIARARAEAADGALSEASTRLREALALWRGPLLGGSEGRRFTAAAHGLHERRMAAVEFLFDLRLKAGESGELVGELRDLIGAEPLRENLRAQLMRALYRAGRRADALDEYRSLAKLLRDELGVDPSPRTRRLHEALLREDTELAEATHGYTTRVAPNTLPHDVADFTGREKALRAAVAAAVAPRRNGARIVAIDGIGGSGKTTLAIRAAHEVASHFPDGQLYIDLQGYTPGETPLTADMVADRLLRLLGHPVELIPQDSDTRIGRWRTESTRRRLLLILDNVAFIGQIQTLLTSSPDSLAIVTSRSHLADLDGTTSISLGEMSTEESICLLIHTLGRDRVAAEAEAARRLAELCGHLPLALRIASARLRKRPHWTLEHMNDKLSDLTCRLRELSSTDRSVASTLRSSYDAMSHAARAALRLLALHPGTDFGLRSAAALLGEDLHTSEKMLEGLLDARLLQQRNLERYGFHDLVRAFVRGLHGSQTQEEDSRALARLLDYYCAATDAACAAAFPGWSPLRVEAEPVAAKLPRLDREETALHWFDAERPSLVEAVYRATASGRYLQAVHLGRNAVFHLNLRGRFTEYEQVAKSAMTAAQRLGDPVLLQLSMSNLAVVFWKLGRLADGVVLAYEGLRAATETGDLASEAHCRGALGVSLADMRRDEEAFEHLERSVSLSARLGLAQQQAESLTTLSTVHTQRGEYHAAIDAATEAAAISRSLGAVETELGALVDEAIAHIGIEDLGAARACLEKAIDMSDDSRLPGNLALAFAYRALVHQFAGDATSAALLSERAQQLAETSSSPIRQISVTNVIGRIKQLAGCYESALSWYRDARRQAAVIGFRAEEIRAELGERECLTALGRCAPLTASQPESRGLKGGSASPFSDHQPPRSPCDDQSETKSAVTNFGDMSLASVIPK